MSEHIAEWGDLVERGAVYDDPERSARALAKIVEIMEATLERGTRPDGRPIHHMTRKSLERDVARFRERLEQLEDLAVLRRTIALLEGGMTLGPADA